MFLMNLEPRRIRERMVQTTKSKILFFLTALLGVLVGAFLWICYGSSTLPDLPTDLNWGSRTKDPIAPVGSAVTPFELNVVPEVIHELRRVLDRNVTFQDPIEGTGFQYGFNSKRIKPLIAYWRNVYLPKWRIHQEFLNKFEQFQMEVNGLMIHFIHEKPKGTPPSSEHVSVPILLLHGWPGSVREFYDLIPKLTRYTPNQIYVFDVVAPSLVGFGFSEATTKKGFCSYEMAIVMRNLMLGLGYNRFIVHGGDWGAIIGSEMATIFPQNVIGYHTNLCLVRTARSFTKLWLSSFAPSFFVDKENYDYHYPLEEKIKMIVDESGYFHMQSTKPDTIGIALTASPIGLAVYILEKFSTGTDVTFRDLEDGGLDNHPIKMDALLDNIMIYYLSNSITSSMRFYAETMSEKQTRLHFDSVITRVPMGCIRFKNDIPSSLDWQLRDKYYDLIHSKYVDRGGHFAAMELPDMMYIDILEFVYKLASENKLFKKKPESRAIV